MSTDVSTRARLRAAVTGSAPLCAPTAVKDVYVRESAALCHVGARHCNVVRNVQQRMALPLVQDTPELVTFAIEQSTKYNQLKVYFKDEQVVSHALEQNGSKQE